MAKGFVYILRCLRGGRFYIGSTSNVQRRLQQHISGNVRATRNIRPVILVFAQEYESFDLARKIETKLKRFKRRDFIIKILKDREIKLGR